MQGNSWCGKAFERFGNLFGLAQPSDFFRVKNHFTQSSVSPLIYGVSVFLAALTKKNKNVAKTSVSLGDGGLFNAFKKDGLYIRIDFEALQRKAFYFQKVNKHVKSFF